MWLGCPMDGHLWSTFFKELAEPGTFCWFLISEVSSPFEGLVRELSIAIIALEVSGQSRDM